MVRPRSVSLAVVFAAIRLRLQLPWWDRSPLLSGASPCFTSIPQGLFMSPMSSPTEALITERPTLPWSRIHPGAQEKLSRFHPDVVAEVAETVAREEWVLVGMSVNPFVARARKLLQQEGIAFTELRYGGYASRWKDRLAIKLWAGFPTFPMVFRRGVLIGGASELIALQRAGGLKD